MAKEKKEKKAKEPAKLSEKQLERQRKKELKNKNISFKDCEYLLAMKPKEKYVFHSDYFEVDNQCAAIMSFFHIDAASDGFPPFWGLMRMPSGLPQEITTISFEQVRRMSKRWIDDHESVAESVAETSLSENTKGGTTTTKTKASRKQQDLKMIAEELADGSAYLSAVFKLMIKAPNLEMLDEAMANVSRLFMDRFGTLEGAPFMGLQRDELSNLFNKNEAKPGKPFYFTSVEYAGAYDLVTHGIEDPDGEYIGYMTGDVNNSAVLFNVNKYHHHLVCASEYYDDVEEGIRIPMMGYWGSKISQSAILNNQRVVHLILDGTKMSKVGPRMKDITYSLNLNKGEVNMFEMFGPEEEELAIFATQMHKLILMAEQAYETTPQDRAVIRGNLERIATRFYVDNRMWVEDALNHREKIRVVNIPHKQVPKLQMFVSYLDQEYTRCLNNGGKDSEEVHALNVLKATFHNLLSTNGNLFNNHTSDAIDGAKSGRRVVYDFSSLAARGRGIAMAQFINIVGFATGTLSKGDVVILHGCDMIDDTVKPYVTEQLDTLYRKGGRVVFLYNDISKMIRDKEFNHFDKADYTVNGTMSATQVEEYQKTLGTPIPGDLSKLVQIKNHNLNYLRRGFTNIVFEQDLSLGLPNRKVVRL